MEFVVDKKIRADTVISFVAIFAMAIFSFAWVQYKVESIEEQQLKNRQFQQEVRQNYINREQLDYIVIERLNRMEISIERNFKEIKEQLNETRN